MRALQALANGVAPLTHLLEIAIDVDTRPVLEIDDQRGLHQIEHRLRACGDLPEALPRECRVGEKAPVRHTPQSSYCKERTLIRSSSGIRILSPSSPPKSTATACP